jgi:hypothetical protein
LLLFNNVRNIIHPLTSILSPKHPPREDGGGKKTELMKRRRRTTVKPERGKAPQGEEEEKERETREVSEAHRQRYRDDLSLSRAKLVAALAVRESGIDEDAVWSAYVGVEKLIAVLRFRLGYETPARFSQLPSEKEGDDDASFLLDLASDLLTTAVDEMAAGELVGAVETLRSVRNDLRGYLTSRRKAATRRPPSKR